MVFWDYVVRSTPCTRYSTALRTEAKDSVTPIEYPVVARVGGVQEDETPIPSMVTRMRRVQNAVKTMNSLAERG